MNLAKLTLVTCAAVCALFSSVTAQWVKQTINTTAGFRGLSVVNEKVVWASGAGGTVIRTLDGGANWNVIKVPDAAKMDFRDIEAFDANTAYILSIGNGESSRIYKTIDGGKTWKLQFLNDDPKKFFDAITCLNRDQCFAMSDPVNGSFPVIGTLDGGSHWQSWATRSRAIAGEAAFAASGTCFISNRTNRGGSILFLVTGGDRASVYQVPLEESSLEFSRADTPISSGSPGSGIFSIAMFDSKNGVIVGGNYEKPNEKNNNLAFTNDGGKTWTLGDGIPGFRSGVTYVDKKTLVTVGSSGSDMSVDGGKTWRGLDKLSYNAVAAKGKKAIWAVGDKGMVAKMK